MMANQVEEGQNVLETISTGKSTKVTVSLTQGDGYAVPAVQLTKWYTGGEKPIARGGLTVSIAHAESLIIGIQKAQERAQQAQRGSA